MKKIFLILFMILFNIFFIFSKKPLEITIFFTNDTNGHPLSFNLMGEKNQGGIPARYTLIKLLSKGLKKRNILILNSGGIIRGRPESNLYEGLPDILGMNKIKYFASGTGTSEFYESMEVLKGLNKNANFYFLSSNAMAANENDKYILDRYIIKEVGGFNGVKIGIFSVITDDAINEISDQAKRDFIFNDPINTAKDMVAELKNSTNNVDIIIALTHLGYYPDNNNIGSSALARAVNGIDIIIDGRTGLQIEEPVMINNTRICQALKWGLFLGEIKLTIVDNKISGFDYKLHPVNVTINGKYIDNKIKENNFVLSAIKKGMKDYDSILKKEIAKVDDQMKLKTNDIRYRETEIGDLICDALLDYTKADVAFQNAGGIGGNESLSGPINRSSLDKIIKYDNSVFVCNIRGEAILKILNLSMNNIGTGSFLQVGGIKFTYSQSSKGFSDVLINGKPIDNMKIYKVAINSWLSYGGDGYDFFANLPGVNKIDYNIIQREVVYNYIEKLKILKPVLEGRINIID